MAIGKIVQISKSVITSSTSSTTVTGIDSDNIYMVVCNSVVPTTSGADLQMRFTESGTANTTSNYDYSNKAFFSNASFSNANAKNQAQFDMSGSISSGSGHSLNNIIYIYNANISAEYTFFSYENIYPNANGNTQGQVGSGMFTVSSAVDGVQFYMDTGNIASAEFILYKVV